MGFVVLLAVVAGFGWAVWLPNWRPSLRAGEQYGVDVSAHRGMVDWFKVARDGIGFAYVKATEGGDFTDARFSENWAGSRAAGIEWGPYHFFTLCTPGAAQAAHFLAVAPPEDRALAPAVDLELAGNCRARPPKHVVDTHLADFFSAVEKAWSSKLVVYLGSDFERRYAVREQLDNLLWRQRFLRRPAGTNVAIWQLHGHARVEGIFGRVDLNIGEPGRLRSGC